MKPWEMPAQNHSSDINDVREARDGEIEKMQQIMMKIVCKIII